MKYVIRKVPERDTSYLERLLPDPLIVCDEKHSGIRWSFRQAILLANDDAVYVQDDMLLCKNFARRAEEYIEKYPDNVIVFSNFTHDKKSCNVVTEGFWNPRAAGWLLCTYIPKKIAMAFVYACDNNLFKRPKNIKKYDLDDMEFSCFLEAFGMDVFVTVPNLAGHPKNESVSGFNRAARICPNFDYENAEV